MLTKLLMIFLILLSVGLNTGGQLLLKQGAGQNPVNIYLLGGLFAYGLSTICYILVLRKFDLSVAYPMVIGLTVIGTTIGGAVLFREPVTFVNWLGVGLLITGISAITLK